MKFKVDNFLGSSLNYDRLLIRLTERFGGTFTFEPIEKYESFDLMWEVTGKPHSIVIAEVRAYIEGYLSH